MSLGVSDPGYPLAEGEHGRLGHHPRARRDGLIHRRGHVTDRDGT
jgi:hypothetical protein